MQAYLGFETSGLYADERRVVIQLLPATIDDTIDVVVAKRVHQLAPHMRIAGPFGYWTQCHDINAPRTTMRIVKPVKSIVNKNQVMNVG